LLTVKWVDKWPVILRQDQPVPPVAEQPALPRSTVPAIPTHGTFDWTDNFQEQQLPYVFNLLRTPTRHWSPFRMKPTHFPCGFASIPGSVETCFWRGAAAVFPG
jgi:beta-xylosidase